MKGIAFWDISPCSLVKIDRRFRRAYCLHHQDCPDDGSSTHLWSVGPLRDCTSLFPSFLSAYASVVHGYFVLSLQIQNFHLHCIQRQASKFGRCICYLPGSEIVMSVSSVFTIGTLRSVHGTSLNNAFYSKHVFRWTFREHSNIREALYPIVRPYIPCALFQCTALIFNALTFPFEQSLQ